MTTKEGVKHRKCFTPPCHMAIICIIKEQHIRFHTVCVENTGWQAKNCMQVKVFQKFFAHFCRCSAVSKDIIRKDNTDASFILNNRHNMLQEIDLVVRSLYKFGTIGIHLNAALRSDSKGRIGQDNIEHFVRLVNQRVLTHNGAFCRTYIVQIKVHGCERYNQWRIVSAEESPIF